MRGFAVMFGMLLAAAQVCGATADLELPKDGIFLGFNAKDRKFTAAIESAPVKKVMSRLGAATGWKVFIDPAAQHSVSAQFTNRATGEALRKLLGSLNFALVPQKDGPAKLLVFQNSARDATELVQPSKEKSNRAKDLIKNELIVSLAKNSKRDIESLAKQLGAKVVGRNDKLRSYRLQFDSEEAAENARNQLASAPDVRVDDNYYVRAPDNPGFQPAEQAPQFNLTPDVNPDACNPIVALIDTKVQPLPPEKSAFLLAPVNVFGPNATRPQSIIPQAAAVTGVQDTPVVPLHGTSMAETILGSMAVASNGDTRSTVRILPVNVYGDSATTSTYEVTMGVYEAIKRGASVINMSLGGDGDSPLLDDLIAQARQRGVMFFAAAGNSPTTAPTYPAANPLVYAVTAGEQDGSIAPYANRGNFIDLIAPGTSFMDFNGTTYRVTGTSPATAIVSGAYATFASACNGEASALAQLQQTFGIPRKP
ncbi:MAG TPA: S8 family serine peptidase [Verrucomicrobiae bacterium]|nr:S8 family serine peptidase [Verrucomicrobiae bacterium]